MNRAARAGVILGVVCGSAAVSPGVASAAPKAPNPNASCVGQIFQPQAIGVQPEDPAPGAVARRIAVIKAEFLAPGESFGDPIGGFLAHATDVCGRR